jgi:tRNA pseudouridine38-40 synthase
MRAAAANFVGRHDFVAFAANRGRAEQDTTRTINRLVIRRRGFLWTLEFDGDGFLYKMVRLMVGGLVDCSSGKLTIAELASRLHKKAIGKSRLAAPAEGLYLVRVRY